MKSIERRVKALEKKAGINKSGISVIIRTGVTRGEHGPEDTGAVCASIVSGPNKGTWMVREEGETETAFLSRVEKTTAGL